MDACTLAIYICMHTHLRMPARPVNRFFHDGRKNGRLYASYLYMYAYPFMDACASLSERVSIISVRTCVPMLLYSSM
jgi:hypothetical protein